MSIKTEQEKFWEGEFGNEYIDRNSDVYSIAKRTILFSKVLTKTIGVNSILEIGANIGHNLNAIRNIMPVCTLGAVEINKKATKTLRQLDAIKVFEGSIFNFNESELGKYDLTFTSGVLIHINPERLIEVYAKLYNCSKKYILIMEYYNPVPIEISYRGHSEKLFKRDFAGEMLNLYPNLELIDYGFQYHRDNNFPADDITWFLMRKFF